jgi:hypothetical protein
MYVLSGGIDHVMDMYVVSSHLSLEMGIEVGGESFI